MSTPNIYQRMRLVSEMVPRVQKDQYNPHHRYAYAGHEDVTSALAPAFVKVGIVQVVDIESIERTAELVRCTVSVAWVNVDMPEDRVVVRAYGESQPGGKGGPQPQQVGVAISYAVKFAQLKCFSIQTGDIPDVEAQDEQREAGPVAQAPEVMATLEQELEAARTQPQLRDFARKAQSHKASISREQYNILAARLGQRLQMMQQETEQ